MGHNTGQDWTADSGTGPDSMDNFYISLNDGTKMPRLGLGTWKAPAEQTKTAVVTAVKAGYRLIDCANDYDNEHVIGEALQELFKEGVVTREDLFIQAKLWNGNHRPEHVKPDLMKTLEDLQLDYVDSFVIHWPQAVPSTGKNPTLRPNGCYPAHHSKDTMFPLTDEGYYSADMESHYVETWEAMEKLVDEGLTKTIGLSNFNRRQVEEVLVSAKKYKPAVLQNESHPYLHEKDLRNYCAINKIAFQVLFPWFGRQTLEEDWFPDIWSSQDWSRGPQSSGYCQDCGEIWKVDSKCRPPMAHTDGRHNVLQVCDPE